MFNVPPFPSRTIIAHEKSMEGIFHSLSQIISPINKYNQVNIETNASESHLKQKYQLLEQNESLQFATIDKGNEDYVSIELVNNYIYLTNFSIKVSPKKYSPTNWKVEGFNRGEWFLVKKITNLFLCGGQQPNCTGAYETFTSDDIGPFTKVKFTSTGFRTDGGHYGHIQINSFELFGILKPIYFCSIISLNNNNFLLSIVNLITLY